MRQRNAAGKQSHQTKPRKASTDTAKVADIFVNAYNSTILMSQSPNRGAQIFPFDDVAGVTTLIFIVASQRQQPKRPFRN